jgi:mannose-6-phosphate isomerase-like protein (cupin superfamily)
MKYICAEQRNFVPASHERPDQPGVLKRVIATAAELQHGQVQMLNWARLPGGSSFQPHYHEDMQEAFVLISGSVRMTCGDQDVDMKPGDCVLVEPREVHQMQNLLSTAAEYVVFGISSGQGGRTIVVAGD